MLTAVLALTLLSSVPPGDRPLSDVLAEAQKSGKPVLLDVFAEWCGPCKALEKNVFPQPEVQAALGRYVFQRYDGEKGEGIAVAKQLGVVGYPSLIVLNPDGVELTRSWPSTQPARFAATLEQLTAIARTRGRATPAELKQRPNDPGLQFLGAVVAARGNERLETIVERYRRAEKADRGNKLRIAELAARERLKLVGPLSSEKVQGELLLDYLRSYPENEFALRALGGIASLDPRDRPPVDQLIPAAERIRGASLTRHDLTGLHELLDALLVLRASQPAVATALVWRALEPNRAVVLDALAEAQYQAGDVDAAVSTTLEADRREPSQSRKAMAERYRNRRGGLVIASSFYNPIGR